jgi:hypothetical protein
MNARNIGGRLGILPRSKSFDDRLLGFWLVDDQEVEIATDHWLYMSGAAEFTISPDGMKLNYPAPKPDWVFSRIAGQGSVLTGIWRIKYAVDSDEVTEEPHFRGNGTYTWQTFVNGHFDSIMLGTYRVSGSSLTTRERRADVRTGPQDTIVIDVAYGTKISGTYSFADDASTWTLHEASGTVITFSRKSP